MFKKASNLYVKIIGSLFIALTFSILILSGSAMADDESGGVLDYDGAPTEWIEDQADTPSGDTGCLMYGVDSGQTRKRILIPVMTFSAGQLPLPI